MGTTQQGGQFPVPLYPIQFIPGCNTPAEATRANLIVNVERELPWLETENLKDRPLVIVGGGPSLNSRWAEIASHGGDILALNNAYSYLIEKDIIPDYFMLLDARPENIDFLRCVSNETRHFIAAQCNPNIFDRLKGYKTTLYLTIMPETLELTAHIDKPKVRIAGTVGTVGIKALSLAYALGYRELYLYGYDSSYEDGYHHAFEQKLNDDANTIEVFLEGKRYVTTGTMANQASEFCALAGGMVRHYGFDINLRCSGLLPDMVAHNNRLGEIPLEIREQQKYEQMWAIDAYRKSAPGESMVQSAIASLGMKQGDSVIDFGCGTGRSSAVFQQLGFNITALDFASNCLDAEVKVPFIQACLWQLPPVSSDWGYCTDVMEHIPPEKVKDVLSGISERCGGAFFNIATRDDAMGSLIGKKLHMTVMSAESWESVLKEFWPNVTKLSETEGEVTFITQ